MTNRPSSRRGSSQGGDVDNPVLKYITTRRILAAIEFKMRCYRSAGPAPGPPFEVWSPAC